MQAITRFIILAAAAMLVPVASAQVAAPVGAAHQRVLPLQGGQNFRDLGGYRTSDGRSVKWGKLYRSGSMHFLTPADYAYLEQLGIRTVCDFRSTQERKAEPVAWPAGKPPRVLADDFMMNMGGIGTTAPGSVPTAADARATMTKSYPQLLSQFNTQYRRMFAELLAGHAPLAFNCTAGKDRTGVAAALLLTALGVPRQTVVEDYVLTNRYFDPRKIVRNDDQASAQWRRLPPDVLQAYVSAEPSYIEAVLTTIDRHPGGEAGYFRNELGLTPARLAVLRRLYTE